MGCRTDRVEVSKYPGIIIGGAGGYYATTLREAGRLAELAGNRDRAIDAYSRYLDLRKDVEPSVQPEVDEVRRALARITGEQG